MSQELLQCRLDSTAGLTLLAKALNAVNFYPQLHQEHTDAQMRTWVQDAYVDYCRATSVFTTDIPATIEGLPLQLRAAIAEGIDNDPLIESGSEESKPFGTQSETDEDPEDQDDDDQDDDGTDGAEDPDEDDSEDQDDESDDQGTSETTNQEGTQGDSGQGATDTDEPPVNV